MNPGTMNGPPSARSSASTAAMVPSTILTSPATIPSASTSRPRTVVAPAVDELPVIARSPPGSWYPGRCPGAWSATAPATASLVARDPRIGRRDGQDDHAVDDLANGE